MQPITVNQPEKSEWLKCPDLVNEQKEKMYEINEIKCHTHARSAV